MTDAIMGFSKDGQPVRVYNMAVLEPPYFADPEKSFNGVVFGASAFAIILGIFWLYATYGNKYRGRY